MQLVLKTFSYRSAEHVMNSNLPVRQEIKSILTDSTLPISELSRPRFNKELDTRFAARGWESQPPVFDEAGFEMARMDFVKSRIGIDVEFGHASFTKMGLLILRIGFCAIDKIDVGVYVVTTGNFQAKMKMSFDQNWMGSVSFEEVERNLPHSVCATQVPILVYGIDMVDRTEK